MYYDSNNSGRWSGTALVCIGKVCDGEPTSPTWGVPTPAIDSLEPENATYLPEGAPSLAGRYPSVVRYRDLDMSILFVCR